MRRLTILGIIGLLFSGCGYQLRQTPNLAKTHPNIHIKSQGFSDLKHQLTNLLISSRVEVNDNDKSTVLKIKKNSLLKKIQSIGANNQVQEYRLEYTVEFEFDKKDYQVFMERDYSFDIQQISGGQQEEQSIRKQLVEDMAWAIVRKINTRVIR